MSEKLEYQKSTLEYIMHYGALLGLFWMFKYLFKIGESYWVHFIYGYALLNVVSPLLMYVFYMKYRMLTPEKVHTLWNCVLFVVGICFFASIFESAIMYAHFTFINPDAFANISAGTMGVTESMINSMEESGSFSNMAAEEVAALKARMEAMASSKVPYIAANVIQQLFTGFIFSLLIGLLTRNRPNTNF